MSHHVRVCARIHTRCVRVSIQANFGPLLVCEAFMYSGSMRVVFREINIPFKTFSLCAEEYSGVKLHCGLLARHKILDLIRCCSHSNYQSTENCWLAIQKHLAGRHAILFNSGL